MQIKGKYSWLKHIDFMVVDVIALFLSFLISYGLKFDKLDWYQRSGWAQFVLIIIMLNVLIALFTNPYSGILWRSYYQEISRALKLMIYNFLIATLILYIFKIGQSYSREMVLYMYVLYFFISLVLKYIWKKLLVSGIISIYIAKRIPIFIIGSFENIEETVRNVLAGDFQLYDILGVHLIDHELTTLSIDTKNFEVINEDFLSFILEHDIHEVLVATQPNEVSRDVYERLIANGIGLNIVIEDAVGFQVEDQHIQSFGVYKALSVGGFTFTPRQMMFFGVKRFVDIVSGIIGLFIIIPVAGIIKIATLLSRDVAPIFYRQTRLGKDGKPFQMWKFRSMVANADEVLIELLKEETYKKQWEANQKLDDDPRITKIGRFLRRTSIDELPQLLNVLVGDMSLVGPRPLVRGELEEHGGLKLYQKVKPGITGWWGCNGRSNIDYRERLELEYYYVKNCSMYLDMLCIFRTVFAVLKKDGAQ